MSPRPCTVAVVGDSLLDVDLIGSVTRICPDAPVPVLDASEVLARPGGAALAATLAARAGHDVVLVTGLGADAAGATVAARAAAEGVEVIDLGLVGATPEKVRLRSDDQSLLRVDRGGSDDLVGNHLRRAITAVEGADAVLVADYGRGVARHEALLSSLGSRRRPLVWDPHPRGGTPVPGTTVVTPNRAELAGFVADHDRSATSAADRTARLAAELAHRWRVGAVAVTLGAKGVVLARARGVPLTVPVRRVAAIDACGAGDAFAAALTGALAGGAVLPAAVERAAAVATDFVAAGGAGAVGLPHDAPDGARFATATHGDPSGATVVATGGCFDLLHAGHVSLLQAAASLGDRLVVLLNSDRSVRRLKGQGRPVQAQDDRRAVLLALGCVDDVQIFDEDTPVRALETLRPDVFVKGGDYAGIDLPEAAVLGRWGGQISIVPYLDGRSTTRILEDSRRGT